MASQKQQNPIERISSKYGVGVGTTPGFIRNRAWANTQKAVGEDVFTPSQVRLLDAMTAIYCITDADTAQRLSVYVAFAQQIRHLSEAAATVWADGTESAIPELVALWRNPGFDPSSSEADADAYTAVIGTDYYDEFGRIYNIDDLSEEEKALVLENYAVLITAGIESRAGAFAFVTDEVAAEVLRTTDCNPFGDQLGEDEKAAAVAVFKLTAAWPEVEAGDQREQLGLLAEQRPHDADRAVALIRDHSPATVTELEGLLDAALTP